MISTNLKHAIYAVWNDIAYDISVGDNDEAVEVCIDAKRLDYFGHPEAQTEVSALIDKHGYTETLEMLAKEVTLV